MKRWKWATNASTWTPTLECPYCGVRFSPIAAMFPSCVVCGNRVRQPKKDYWESMKEEQRTCYNCKYKTSSNHQLRCTKGDYWKRIHKAKIPCKDWKEGGE